MMVGHVTGGNEFLDCKVSWVVEVYGLLHGKPSDSSGGYLT